MGLESPKEGLCPPLISKPYTRIIPSFFYLHNHVGISKFSHKRCPGRENTIFRKFFEGFTNSSQPLDREIPSRPNLIV